MEPLDMNDEALVSNILIIYSSVHGYTQKICQRMSQQLVASGADVTLKSFEDVEDISPFDKVIIGASIRHGKHRPAVYEFIEHYRSELDKKITAFFAVSLVARKPAKNTPETNPYMQAFLQKTSWRPTFLSVFAGNLNYQGYGAMDRNIIRFIMWITKGPTDPNTKVEFTDWDRVDQLADQLGDK